MSWAWTTIVVLIFDLSSCFYTWCKKKKMKCVDLLSYVQIPNLHSDRWAEFKLCFIKVSYFVGSFLVHVYFIVFFINFLLLCDCWKQNILVIWTAVISSHAVSSETAKLVRYAHHLAGYNCIRYFGLLIYHSKLLTALMRHTNAVRIPLHESHCPAEH